MGIDDGIRLTDVVRAWAEERNEEEAVIADQLARVVAGAPGDDAGAWIVDAVGRRAARRVKVRDVAHHLAGGAVMGPYPDFYAPPKDRVIVSKSWLRGVLQGAGVPVPAVLAACQPDARPMISAAVAAAPSTGGARQRRARLAVQAAEEILARAARAGERVDRSSLPGRWDDLVDAMKRLHPGELGPFTTETIAEYVKAAGIRFRQGGERTDLYGRVVSGGSIGGDGGKTTES